MTEQKNTPPPRKWSIPLPAPWRAANQWLARCGFSAMPKKVLYRTLLTGFLAILGSIGPWEHAPQVRWFGVFALFSAWNFFGLVALTNSMISSGWYKGAGFKTFFSFQIRLFLTAFFVYAALVWWSVPVVALVAGLSTALLWALAGVLAPKNG